MKRLKNIENKSEEQLKVIEGQKKFQTKIISKNKIKALLLKSIYSQDVKGGRIDGYETKKNSKLLKTWRLLKLTTQKWCTGQVIMSILTFLGLDHYLVFI